MAGIIIDASVVREALIPLSDATSDLSEKLSTLVTSNTDLEQSFIGESVGSYIMINEYVRHLIHKETELEEGVIEILNLLADEREEIDTNKAGEISG